MKSVPKRDLEILDAIGVTAFFATDKVDGLDIAIVSARDAAEAIREAMSQAWSQGWENGFDRAQENTGLSLEENPHG